jgi:hypothetical protein
VKPFSTRSYTATNSDKLSEIATVGELVTPFELEGYLFTSYAKDWWEADAWVASKIIRAKSAGLRDLSL